MSGILITLLSILFVWSGCITLWLLQISVDNASLERGFNRLERQINALSSNRKPKPPFTTRPIDTRIKPD